MVSTSTVSSERWPNLAGEGVAARNSGRVALRKAVGYLDDAVLLLVVAWLFPAVILLLGAPVALAVRFVLEIAQRM